MWTLLVTRFYTSLMSPYHRRKNSDASFTRHWWPSGRVTNDLFWHSEVEACEAKDSKVSPPHILPMTKPSRSLQVKIVTRASWITSIRLDFLAHIHQVDLQMWEVVLASRWYIKLVQISSLLPLFVMECKSEHMLSKTFAATFVPRIPAASHSLGTYIYDLHVADSILYSLYRLPPLLPFSVVTMRKR
jgi:hypothetical protein